MAVDLFSLRMNLDVTGAAQAKSALQEIDAIGRRTASAMRGIGDDARMATRDLLTGRASLADFGTAIAVAHQQASTLGGGFRGLATTAAGVFRGIGDAAVAGFQRVAGAVGGMLSSPLGKILTLTAVIAELRAAFGAADQLTRSLLQLEGSARRAGVPIDLLQRSAAQFKEEFRTATPTANEIAATMARMGQRAGDLNIAQKAMRDFLNVGASLGLSASETLFRVDQAMRGLDEGTDVLFQKNPSQIYKEYAQSIGTTAGALTSAQQAQALMNEAMIVAARDPGAYQRFLETTLGKQGQFNARLLEAQALFGAALGPLRLFALELGTKLLNGFSAAIVGLQQGWGTLRSLFGDALPGIVQVGAGKVLLVLANWAASVTSIFAKIGIHLGTGMVASLGEAGARMLAVGRANLAAFEAQRQAVNRAMDEAAGEGAGVDMTPVVFPDLPGSSGGTAGGTGETAAQRRKRILGLANMDESMKPVSRLDFQGLGGPVGLKDPLSTGGSVTAPSQRPGVRFMDTLRQDLFEGLQRLQPFQQGLQGFFQNLFATGKLSSSIKAFGQDILAGMGSIFAKMAMKAIAAAPLFQAIGAAMRNPFTAGFALLAFGIALKALAASMGGAATGESASSGGFGDRQTTIRLTANDAGGIEAPTKQAGPTIKVFGKDDPEGHRLFGEFRDNTARRNI